MYQAALFLLLAITSQTLWSQSLPTRTFTITFDFTDRSGTSANGLNYVIKLSNFGFVTISAILHGAVSGRTSGTIRLEMSTRRDSERLGPISVNFINALGHRSNLLEGTF